jgi:hypothetical protein
MCLHKVSKSLVEVQPDILDIFFLGELHIFIWTGTHVSVCMMNAAWNDLDTLACILHFKTSFGMLLGWFSVSMKNWLDHCPCLVL